MRIGIRLNLPKILIRKRREPLSREKLARRLCRLAEKLHSWLTQAQEIRLRINDDKHFEASFISRKRLLSLNVDYHFLKSNTTEAVIALLNSIDVFRKAKRGLVSCSPLSLLNFIPLYTILPERLHLLLNILLILSVLATADWLVESSIMRKRRNLAKLVHEELLSSNSRYREVVLDILEYLVTLCYVALTHEPGVVTFLTVRDRSYLVEITRRGARAYLLTSSL